MKIEFDEDYKVKNNIDFTTVTACGECCVGCKKKEDFPCEWLIKKVVWRQNVVEELTELANLYCQQN